MKNTPARTNILFEKRDKTVAVFSNMSKE